RQQIQVVVSVLSHITQGIGHLGHIPFAIVPGMNRTTALSSVLTSALAGVVPAAIGGLVPPTRNLLALPKRFLDLPKASLSLLPREAEVRRIARGRLIDQRSVCSPGTYRVWDEMQM